LRSEADKIWSSIPAGTVVARNGSPVGSNEKVQELRGRAENIDQDVTKQKRAVAREYIATLLGKSDTLSSNEDDSIWKEHAALISELQALENRNAWYYHRNGRAICFDMIHGLAYWISYLFFLSVLLAFDVVVQLFEFLTTGKFSKL
jgi:hypothetical protein